MRQVMIQLPEAFDLLVRTDRPDRAITDAERRRFIAAVLAEFASHLDALAVAAALKTLNDIAAGDRPIVQ
jgi:hypothetical protein